MQPLSREVMKHEVDDAPGIECLGFGHVAAIHGLLRAGLPGLRSPRVSTHQMAPSPHRRAQLETVTCQAVLILNAGSKPWPPGPPRALAISSPGWAELEAMRRMSRSLTSRPRLTSGDRPAANRERVLAAEAVEPNQGRDTVLGSSWRSQELDGAADPVEPF